ncbi:hypothetical protein ACWEKM_21625 [Streptomyces sp. NPDC004752]
MAARRLPTGVRIRILSGYHITLGDLVAVGLGEVLTGVAQHLVAVVFACAGVQAVEYAEGHGLGRVRPFDGVQGAGDSIPAQAS